MLCPGEGLRHQVTKWALSLFLPSGVGRYGMDGSGGVRKESSRGRPAADSPPHSVVLGDISLLRDARGMGRARAGVTPTDCVGAHGASHGLAGNCPNAYSKGRPREGVGGGGPLPCHDRSGLRAPNASFEPTRRSFRLKVDPVRKGIIL